MNRKRSGIYAKYIRRKVSFTKIQRAAEFFEMRNYITDCNRYLLHMCGGSDGTAVLISTCPGATAPGNVPQTLISSMASQSDPIQGSMRLHTCW